MFVAVTHRDLPPLSYVFWWLNHNAEHTPNSLHELVPFLGLSGADDVTEVPEDFCRATFTNTHTDGPLIKTVFRCCKSRHGGQISQANL